MPSCISPSSFVGNRIDLLLLHPIQQSTREALSSKMVGDILGCMLCFNLAFDIGGCISDCDSEVRRSIHIGIETVFSKLSTRVCYMS